MLQQPLQKVNATTATPHPPIRLLQQKMTFNDPQQEKKIRLETALVEMRKKTDEHRLQLTNELRKRVADNDGGVLEITPAKRRKQSKSFFLKGEHMSSLTEMGRCIVRNILASASSSSVQNGNNKLVNNNNNNHVNHNNDKTNNNNNHTTDNNNNSTDAKEKNKT